jgi:hypothetical protein
MPAGMQTGICFFEYFCFFSNIIWNQTNLVYICRTKHKPYNDETLIQNHTHGRDCSFPGFIRMFKNVNNP